MKRHKNQDTTDSGGQNPDFHGGVMSIPRSRGAFSGMLLIIFGAWAALIPFIGPLFKYGYTPNKAWDWSSSKGWLEVLPGLVAVVAGVILIMTANRAMAQLAGWIAVAAGVWLIIGRDVAPFFHIASPGSPASSKTSLAALERIGLFSGIGALILATAALAVGRLSVRSVRDVRVAQKHERKQESKQRGVSDAAYQKGREDEAAERERMLQQARQEAELQAQQHPTPGPAGAPNQAPGQYSTGASSNQQEGLRY